MIDGVTITPLLQIPDDRGNLMHMMKRTDSTFSEFGEIYFSRIRPGAIKAWHIHDKMTLNYAVPHGTIKLVLFDERDGSPTLGELNEIFLGEGNYQLVTIPPNVWNGFQGIGSEIALLANCATIPHDPNEIRRLEPYDRRIPYNWDLTTK